MYPGAEPASSKTHEKVTFKVKLITNTEEGKLRQNKMTETAGQSRKEKLGTNLKNKKNLTGKTEQIHYKMPGQWHTKVPRGDGPELLCVGG